MYVLIKYLQYLHFSANITMMEIIYYLLHF